MDYLGIKANRYCIVSGYFNESCTFDSFGKMLSVGSRDSAYAEGYLLRDIHVFSVVGSSTSRMCEVYLDGKVATVQGTYLETMAKVRDNVQLAVPIVFRVPHDCGAMQVILALKSDSANTHIRCVSDVLNIPNWGAIAG